MAENDSLEALNQEQPPSNLSVTQPSKRDNDALTNASSFIPKQYQTEVKDNSLSRDERIAKEQSVIDSSIKQKTGKSTSHNGVDIEFSEQDYKNTNIENDQPQQQTESLNDLTKRLTAAQLASNASSSNKQKEIEDHENKMQANKEYKSKSYDNPNKLQKENHPNVEKEQPKKKENEVEIKHVNVEKEQPLDLDFKKKYVLDQNGNYRYSFDTKKTAFQDKGEKVIINSTSQKTHEDVVKLLASKGAEKIHVTGLKSVKEGIWIAAQDRGIEVTGFEPSMELKERYENNKNTVTIVKKEDQLSKDDKKSLDNNESVASKVADEKLAPENRNTFNNFVRAALYKTVASGQNLPKVRVTNKEATAEASSEI